MCMACPNLYALNVSVRTLKVSIFLSGQYDFYFPVHVLISFWKEEWFPTCVFYWDKLCHVCCTAGV